MRTLGGMDVFVYSVVAAMLVSTHYFGFLVVFAQALLVLIGMLESPWDRKRLCRFGLAGLFVLLCIAPQIPYMYSGFVRGNFWIPAPNDNFFIDLFVLYFGNLPLSVLAAVLLGIAVSKCLVDERKMADFKLFFIWVVICITVPYVRSLYIQPVLTMRNLIVLLPAILVLFAFALNLFNDRWGRISLGGLILCFSMTPLFTNYKPVFTFENQLKPVSQIRDLVEELIKVPAHWPMYSWQYLEFGVYFRLLDSSLSVSGEDQLKRDLLAKERPENFYYLVSRGGHIPDESFMRQYAIVLSEEKKVGDSVALKFRSLNLPIDKNLYSPTVGKNVDPR